MRAKQEEQKMDMVNHPPHYNKAGIETIDAIMAATDGVLNIIYKVIYSNMFGDTDTKMVLKI